MSASRRSCKAMMLGAVLCAAPVHPSIAQAADKAPQRVMSLNICTDQLLLALAPPRRIASVTFMAHEPAPLRRWPQAAHIPANRGSAEEVLAARPDMVLTGPFLPALTRSLLERSGARIVTVPLAEDFEQIARVTRMVARAVGAQARGEVLVAQMRADLRAMEAARPRTPITIAEWGNGGFVPGQGGLFGAMLKAAGARSITGSGGYYDVETLVAGRPLALLFADTYAGLPTLRADQDDHPALRTRIPRVSYSSFYGCGVPQAAASARAMQAALRKAVTP